MMQAGAGPEGVEPGQEMGVGGAGAVGPQPVAGEGRVEADPAII